MLRGRARVASHNGRPGCSSALGFQNDTSIALLIATRAGSAAPIRLWLQRTCGPESSSRVIPLKAVALGYSSQAL